MAFTTQTKYSASNYRTGQNANEYYCYVTPAVTNNPVEKVYSVTIRPDSYFLCRKIHMSSFLNAPTSLKIIDTKHNRVFQNQFLNLPTVAGSAASPNILAAPILFDPASVIQIITHDLGGLATNFFTLEGEKVYNPDPAWVQKMRSRFWYQFGVLDSSGATPLTLTLDIKDPNFDFAICKVMSFNLFQQALVANIAPGRVRIREKGPNNMYWSNIDLPDRLYATVYGTSAGAGFGPHHIIPPVVIPGTSQLEIFYTASPSGTPTAMDFVFDGFKFPRGSNPEDWL